MGGHGALTLALKYPHKFRSVSAFAPICAPTQSPWGIKAFTAYLGENNEDWLNNDANELMKTSSLTIPMLIDQGSEDEFLEKELNFNQFKVTCANKNYLALSGCKKDMIIAIILSLHSLRITSDFMLRNLIHEC